MGICQLQAGCEVRISTDSTMSSSVIPATYSSFLCGLDRQLCAWFALALAAALVNSVLVHLTSTTPPDQR